MKTVKRFLITIVIFTILLDVAITFGATITLQDADTENLGDSYVRQEISNNYGTSPGLTVMSWQWMGTHRNRRAFIKWGLSAVPPGSTITDARLYLYMYDAPSVSRTYDAYNSSNTWNETDITWGNKPNQDTYQSNTATGTVNNIWLSWDVTNAAVYQFSQTLDQNLSIVIKDSSESSSPSRTANFYSKEYLANTSARPYLIITYSTGDDLTPPTVSIQHPLNTTYNYNTSLPLNYTTTDESGIDSCWYNIGNGANQSLTNCENIVFDINEGHHTLYLFANDTKGNLNTEIVSFTVELITINTDLFDPLTGNIIYSNNMTFHCNVTGNSDIRNISLWTNTSGSWLLDQTIDLSSSSKTNYFAEFNLSNISLGNYKWNCQAFDNDLNMAWESTNWSFTISEITNTTTTSSSSTTTSSSITTTSIEPTTTTPTPVPSGGGGYTPSGGYKPDDIDIDDVNISNITDNIPESDSIPVADKEGNIELQIDTPDMIESGEEYEATIAVKADISYYNVKLIVGDQEEIISLTKDVEKHFTFTLLAPEAKGSFNLIANVTTDDTTSVIVKEIALDYKPLFLYTELDGNKLRLTIKTYEEDLQTEIDISRDGTTVYLDYITGKRKYIADLNLIKPGRYKVFVKTSTAEGIIDEDIKFVSITGISITDYWIVILIVGIVAIVIVSISLYKKKDRVVNRILNQIHPTSTSSVRHF